MRKALVGLGLVPALLVGACNLVSGVANLHEVPCVNDGCNEGAVDNPVQPNGDDAGSDSAVSGNDTGTADSNTGSAMDGSSHDSSIVDSGSSEVTSPTTLAFVQVGGAIGPVNATLTSLKASYPSAQHAGDLNLIVVGWGDVQGTVSAVTDTAGNTYTVVDAVQYQDGVGEVTQTIYYAANIVASATNAVTVQFTNGGASSPDVSVIEYSGVSHVDQYGWGRGDSVSGTTAAVTTTHPTELVFAAGTTFDSSYLGAGTGFTLRFLTGYDDVLEDTFATAPGTYTATAPINPQAMGMVLGAGPWAMQVVTFY